ncbi:unnamed protein product [Discula destructiva]
MKNNATAQRGAPPGVKAPASTRQQTERTPSENKERAYVAASRRGDRSIEARLESARSASQCHFERTGKYLKIDENIVRKEEMYEEEDDHLPRAFRTMFNNTDVPQRFRDASVINMAMAFGHNPSEEDINKQFAAAFPGMSALRPSFPYAPMVSPMATQVQQGQSSGSAFNQNRSRPSAVSQAALSPTQLASQLQTQTMVRTPSSESTPMQQIGSHHSPMGPPHSPMAGLPQSPMGGLPVSPLDMFSPRTMDRTPSQESLRMQLLASQHSPMDQRAIRDGSVASSYGHPSPLALHTDLPGVPNHTNAAMSPHFAASPSMTQPALHHQRSQSFQAFDSRGRRRTHDDFAAGLHAPMSADSMGPPSPFVQQPSQPPAKRNRSDAGMSLSATPFYNNMSALRSPYAAFSSNHTSPALYQKALQQDARQVPTLQQAPQPRKVKTKTNTKVNDQSQVRNQVASPAAALGEGKQQTEAKPVQSAAKAEPLERPTDTELATEPVTFAEGMPAEDSQGEQPASPQKDFSYQDIADDHNVDSTNYFDGQEDFNQFSDFNFDDASYTLPQDLNFNDFLNFPASQEAEQGGEELFPTLGSDNQDTDDFAS